MTISNITHGTKFPHHRVIISNCLLLKVNVGNTNLYIHCFDVDVISDKC